MFFIRRNLKLGLLFSCHIFFNYAKLGPVPVDVFIILCCILSEFSNWKVYWRKIVSRRIVLVYFAVVAVLMLTTAAFSEHLHSPFALGSYVLREFVAQYGLFFLAFCLVRSESNIHQIHRILIPAVMLMTLFAVLNFLIGSSPFIDALREETTNMYAFKDAIRFRVRATFVNPFDYGYFCVINLLLAIYSFVKKKLPFKHFALSALCSLFGIVTCGCRTILICMFICVLIFFFCTFRNARSKIIILVGSVMFLGLSYVVVPPVRKVVDNALTVFDPDSDIDGSSLTARGTQLAAVILQIQGSPLIGRGYQYFVKDIGWSDEGTASSSDAELLGLEGIYLEMLLERGVIGFLLYLVLLGVLIQIVMSARKHARIDFSLAMSVLVAYIIFAFGTGELLSYPPMILLTGALYMSSQRKRCLHSSQKNTPISSKA